MADLKNFYNNALKKGIIDPSVEYDAFAQSMHDANDRKSFYEFATQRGLQIGSPTEFNTYIDARLSPQQLRQKDGNDTATSATNTNGTPINPRVKDFPAPTTEAEYQENLRRQEAASDIAPDLQNINIVQAEPKKQSFLQRLTQALTPPEAQIGEALMQQAADKQQQKEQEESDARYQRYLDYVNSQKKPKEVANPIQSGTDMFARMGITPQENPTAPTAQQMAANRQKWAQEQYDRRYLNKDGKPKDSFLKDLFENWQAGVGEIALTPYKAVETLENFSMDMIENGIFGHNYAHGTGSATRFMNEVLGGNYLRSRVEHYRKESDRYQDGQGIIESALEGDFGKAAGKAVLGTIQSAPNLAVSIYSGKKGMETLGGTFLGVTAALQKYDEIKDREDLSAATKAVDIFGAFVSECVPEIIGAKRYGKMFNRQTVGEVRRQVQKETLKAWDKFVQSKFAKTMGKGWDKVMDWFGEGLTEGLTDIMNLTIDRALGVKDEVTQSDILGIGDSFIIGQLSDLPIQGVHRYQRADYRDKVKQEIEQNPNLNRVATEQKTDATTLANIAAKAVFGENLSAKEQILFDAYQEAIAKQTNMQYGIMNLLDGAGIERGNKNANAIFVNAVEHSGKTQKEARAILEKNYEDRTEAEQQYLDALVAKMQEQKRIIDAIDNEMPVYLGESELFGSMYQWARGKNKEAADFLTQTGGGYLKGVFYREGLGEVDALWGNDRAGLNKIIEKHIRTHNDFASIEEAMSVIDQVISFGEERDEDGRKVIELAPFRVVLSKSKEGTWVLSAYDFVREEEEKRIVESPAENSPRSAAPEGSSPLYDETLDQNGINSDRKGTTNSAITQEETQKVSQIAFVNGGELKNDTQVYQVSIAGQPDRVGYIVSGEATPAVGEGEGGKPIFTSNSQVTIKWADGSAPTQHSLNELDIVSIGSAADLINANVQQRMVVEQGKQTFKAGQQVSYTDPQTQQTYTSNVVSVTDEGVEVEIQLPNGQTNTTRIPFDQALQTLKPIEQTPQPAQQGQQPQAGGAPTFQEGNEQYIDGNNKILTVYRNADGSVTMGEGEDAQQISADEWQRFTQAEGLKPYQQPVQTPQTKQQPRVPDIKTDTAEDYGLGTIAYFDNNQQEALSALQDQLQEKQNQLKRLQEKKPKLSTDFVKRKQQLDEQAKQINDLQTDIDKLNKAIEVATAYKSPEQQAEEERLARIAQATAETGVRDWLDGDSAADARKRGWRMVNGYKVNRQQPVSENGALLGKETRVAFSDKPQDEIGVQYAVIPAAMLQPSHRNGQRNPQFFIPEAQPKNRRDAVSVEKARQIAHNIHPEQIVSDAGTAYVGSPIVNSRGEVIQGNNRTAALQEMYSGGHEQSVATYKQYLMEHAADFGLNAEDIAKIENPVLVRLSSATDERAIQLGQKTAADMESGGKQNISAKNVASQMSEEQVRQFAQMLLTHSNENASLRECAKENGVRCYDWLLKNGFINETQYDTAVVNDNGNKHIDTSTDAAQSLIDILQRALFVDSKYDDIEMMFEVLPNAAKKALLQTIVRDMQTPKESRILGDIQDAMAVLYRIKTSPDFKEELQKSKGIAEIRAAINAWANQMQISGDSTFAYRDIFSNFALELAIRLQSTKQNDLVELFDDYYDRVQGMGRDLFNAIDHKYSKAEAAKEIFNVELNENNDVQSEGSPAVGINSETSTGGSGGGQPQGRTGANQVGEPTAPQGGSGTTQRGSQTPSAGSQSATADTGSSGSRVESAHIENIRKKAADFSQKLGVNIVVFANADELPNTQTEAKKVIASLAPDQSVNAWYDPRTRSVFIYAPNIKDENDLTAKVFHEAVAHLGLREMMNRIDKGVGFDKLCRSVWNSMDEQQREQFIAYAYMETMSLHKGMSSDDYSQLTDKEKQQLRNNDYAQRVAADEYIAHLAEQVSQLEDTDNTPTASAIRRAWQEIVEIVRKILNSALGRDIKMSDKELSDLIKLSYLNLRQQAQSIENDTKTTTGKTQEALEQYRQSVKKQQEAYNKILSIGGALGTEENTQRAAAQAEHNKTVEEANNAQKHLREVLSVCTDEELQQMADKADAEGDSFARDAYLDEIRYRKRTAAKQVTSFSISKINEQFNSELADLTEDNADIKTFSLGSPSPILRSAGVVDKPMKLYGNKIIKKAKLHGFDIAELKDLPKAVADPIAVFNNYQTDDNRSILTELKTKDGNFLVTLTVGKGGVDIDFNLVSSVFGKKQDGIVNWLNKGYATYINKEKTLDYLHFPAPIAAAADNQELNHAAKIVKDFDNPKLPTEKSAKFSISAPQPSDVRFSTSGTHTVKLNDRTLVGLHNINRDKLRKVFKQGGLANPSAAVIDIARQNHEGYGEVSLVLPSSLVDSRTGRNAGTYAGDAYTPMYPAVEYQRGKDTAKKLNELTKGLPDNLASTIRRMVDYYMEGNSRQSGLEYLFLKEKGQELPIASDNRQYPNISINEINKRIGATEEEISNQDTYNAYERMPESELYDFNLWLAKHGNTEEMQKMNDLISRLESEGKTTLADNMRSRYAKRMSYSSYISLWDSVMRDERDAGQENIGKTIENAVSAINDQGLREEFEDWKRQKIDELGYNEVIFNGYTPSGTRRYLPNTVENASRIMNQSDQTNWTGGEGVNETKALLVDKFRTLDQIRKNKKLLESDGEKVKQAYEEAWNEWSDLGTELFEITMQDERAFPLDENRFIAHDTALARLQEAITSGKDPIAYLNKEYRYSIPQDHELGKRLKAIAEKIKNLPSKYFETKFRRPVYLNEFAAAVVPQDLPQDLKDGLQQSGLQVYEYDPETDGSRREATLKATEGEGIRFSVSRPIRQDVAREMQEIKAKAQANGTFMKAPNGKPTNLNEEQWLLTRTANFKRWFGDWTAQHEAEVELPNRLYAWLSDENIEQAKGKTREEIYEIFGNEPQAIAYIPVRFLSLVDSNLTDNRVYSGMGYFIDHAVNHHPSITREKYQNIQEVLNNPDEVKAIKDNGNDSVVFIKQIDRFNAVVIEVEKTDDGRIVWHKSFYDQKKKPYANKGTRLYDVSSEGGVSPIIRTDESAHDSSLSVLDDAAKVQNFLEPSKSFSKILDENGEPLVVYHNTPKEFTIFDPNKSYPKNSGFWFSEEPFDHYGDRLVEAFLNLRDPKYGTVPYDIQQNIGNERGLILDGETESGKKYRFYLAGLPNQIKSATDNDGSFSEQNDDIRFSISNQRGDIFYSNAERAVEQIKQEKATPEQWRAMIEKQGGLKAGEDKWLGLSDWLKQQQLQGLEPPQPNETRQEYINRATNHKVTLTKQQILDYIRQNKIQIEEVEYGAYDEQQVFEDYRREFKGYYDEAAAAGEEDPSDVAWNRMLEEHGEDFGMGFYAYGDELQWDNDSDYIKWELQNSDGNNGMRPINDTRMRYTTEGLENKREIALTVPTIESWNEGDEIHFGDAGEGRAVAWVRFGDAEAESENVTQAKQAYDNFVKEMIGKYGSAYERAMSDDEYETYKQLGRAWSEASNEQPAKVLVIDEIQSKRHQEGREKGYGTNIPLAQMSDIRFEDVMENGVPVRRGFYEVEVDGEIRQYKGGFLTEDYVSGATAINDDILREINNQVKEANIYNHRKGRDKVPAAPFEKNWHELAMKRILRFAAENGYDKVAWTTGDQQAERYNIGNVVESIEVGKWLSSEDTLDDYGVDETRVIQIKPKNSSPIFYRFDRQGNILSADSLDEVEVEDGQKLSDIVGKEMANTLLTTDQSVIEGDGLRIGGEGMRGFYDDMLPRFMQKYGKKWGAKVGEVTMPQLEDGYQTMHSVDVTPQMRESVMQGQPMFSISRKPNTLEETNKRFNEELQQQIDGTLPANHIYDLGTPSKLLRDYGIADLPMQLSAKKLLEKATEYDHDYDLSEVRDLVKAINQPIAIFKYGDATKAQNIVIEIQHNDKNFIVGISIRPKVNGRILEINSIRNVFPKDNAEWLNWIMQDKALYLDKEKIQTLIDQQRTNLADVEYLDLNLLAKLVKDFDNSKHLVKNLSENDEQPTIQPRENETKGEYAKRVAEESRRQNPKDTSLDDAIRFSIKVNHNSPHLLKKADGSFRDAETGERLGFDHRFMGSGEGGQAHGWGSYFSKNDIRDYANGNNESPRINDIFNTSKWEHISGVVGDKFDIARFYMNYATDEHAKSFKSWLEDRLATSQRMANRYEGMSIAEISGLLTRDEMHLYQRAKGDVEYIPQLLSDLKRDADMRNRHHYDVEIPDNNGSNYIEEAGKVGEDAYLVRNELEQAILRNDTEGAYKGHENDLVPELEDAIRPNNLWRDTYGTIAAYLGGQQQASEFLHDIGYVGIHYDGRRDGECYVIFDENDAQITNHLRFSISKSKSAEQVEQELQDNGYSDESNVRFSVAYHGSGADFEKFLLSKIGTGEGSQSFGYGLYFSQAKEIARNYAQRSEPKKSVEYHGIRYESDEMPNLSKPVEPYEAALAVMMMGTNEVTSTEQAIAVANHRAAYYERAATIANSSDFMRRIDEQYAKNFRNAIAYFQKNGIDAFKVESTKHNLYTVSIPDDKRTTYFDWDSEPSPSKKDAIRRALLRRVKQGALGVPEYWSDTQRSINAQMRLDVSNGSSIYFMMTQYVTPEQISQILAEAGYKGIKYAAGRNYGLNGADESTKNYVVFDENDIEITDHVRFSVSGKGVGQQAEIGKLNKVSDFITNVLQNNTQQRSAKIDLPEYINRKAEREIGHKIVSHSINANEIRHTKNRHGENGSALTEKSIPLRDKDIALMPYIMAAPTRVEKGTMATNGTESIRYIKELGNGIVVVVEREGRFDREEMENITMWAKKKPSTNVTVAQRASHSTSETIVISEDDIAKIKQDADEAVRKTLEQFSSAPSSQGYAQPSVSDRKGTTNNSDTQENSENSDEEVKFSVTRPTPMPNETMRDYIQRYQNWREAQVDNDKVAEYVRMVNDDFSKWQQTSRKFGIAAFDYAKPIEDFQEWIKQQGGKVGEGADAYNFMFQAKSRVTKQTEDFVRERVRPLAEAYTAIIKSKRLDDLTLTWQGLDETGIPDKLRKNGTQLSAQDIIGVYLQAKDVQEAIEKDLADRGAAGFVNNLGMSHTDLIAAVESRLSPEQISRLWDAVRGVNKFALDYQLQGGMITQETYDKFQDREYYVPQRGWRERDLLENQTEYRDTGGKRYGDPYNAALVKAKGRQSLASDPIAYMISIGESAIISTENNRVKQHLLQLLLDNEEIGLKSKSFRVKKFWLMNQIDPATGRIALDQNGNKRTPEAVYMSPTQEDYEHDAAIQKQIEQEKKHQLTLKDPAAIQRSQDKIADLEDQLRIVMGMPQSEVKQRTEDEWYQHEMVVLKDGQKYLIELQDEKLANAINKNFAHEQEEILNTKKRLRQATRFISASLTQYNPEFAMSNFMRDYQVAIATLMVEQGVGFTAAFAKNFAVAQKAIWVTAFNDKVRERNKYTNDDMGRLLDEYMHSGAPTGFTYMRDLDLLQQDFNQMLKDNKGKEFARGLLGMFSMLTEVSETSVRFAAYATARQRGMSIEQAAALSKELTTNFDRAGEMSQKTAMSIFSFFRATINGNLKFLKAFKKFPVGYSAVAAMYAVIGMLNALLRPNDPDDEVWAGDYTREGNIIIGKWKIPTAHFLRMFYAAGVNLGMAIRGDKSKGNAVYDTVDFAAGELLPNWTNAMNWFEWNEEYDRPEFTWKGGVQASAPNAISPIVDVRINRDFMGGTVNREPFVKTQEDEKDILQSKKNVGKFYDDVAKTIYKAVGGDLEVKSKGDDNTLQSIMDFSGSSLQHIVEGYMPSGAGMLFDTYGVIRKAISGEEISGNDIPFVRKFRTSYDTNRAYNQQYRRLKRRSDAYENLLDQWWQGNEQKYDRATESERYRAWENAQEYLWENDEPTKQDVRDLMEANREWNRSHQWRKAE